MDWERECQKRQKDQLSRNQNLHRRNTNNYHNQSNNYGHSLSLQKSQEQTIQQHQHPSSQTADNNLHLFVIQSATATRNKIFDLWFADLGLTDHMTFQKEYFTTFPDNSCFVRVGGGRKLSVQGVGDIEVQVTSNQGVFNITQVVKDVLFLPDLERNSISATEKGMEVVFIEGGK